MTCITCHQPRRLRAVSLFNFFRFCKGSARARERQSRETSETRAAVTRVAHDLRVSRFARRTAEKRETARSLSTSSPGLFPQKKPWGRG